ncbi:MAG: M14 family zinc carboxypeptidase [Acidobacteriota bacterium]
MIPWFASSLTTASILTASILTASVLTASVLTGLVLASVIAAPRLHALPPPDEGESAVIEGEAPLPEPGLSGGLPAANLAESFAEDQVPSTPALSVGGPAVLWVESPPGDLYGARLRGLLTPYRSEIDLWKVQPHKGGALVAATATGASQLLSGDLQRQGVRVLVDEERTRWLRQAGRYLEGQIAGIPGFPCYRTVEESDADGADLATQYPQLVRRLDVGDSWEKTQGLGGYDLWLMEITRQDITGPKPILFVNGGIHAREYTTPETSLRFAEWLVTGYGVDADITWLLDYHAVHIIPQSNPDGRKRAESGLSWRKNTNNDFCSATDDRGIDLNRNFLFRWGCCGGSSTDPCSPTFRGSSAGSEPEADAVMAALLARYPDRRPDDTTTPAPQDVEGIFLDLHSFGEDVLWSWGFSTVRPPNDAALYSLGRKYAYFTQYRPQHGSFSTVDGATKDFAYGELGVPGFTIELGTSFFQDCADFEGRIWPENRDALLYSAKASRAPYLLPSGPDVVSLTATPTAIIPGDSLTVTATVDDTRYSNANGTEPTQAVMAAELTVDDPPFAGEGAAIPFVPVDGTFDSSTEDVMVSVDTAGWEVGRHALFAQGQDANGQEGVLSSTFVYVLDPVLSPRIEGQVRDRDQGTGLVATISAGPFSTVSDASGAYSLRVLDGQYEVRAQAPGYAEVLVGGVTTGGAGSAVTVDFDLAAVEEIFADDGESGGAGWSADAPWALTQEQALSPTHSWSDSPGGDYGNSANVSLISPALSTLDRRQVRLSWAQRFDLEATWDFGRVEISTDGGANWETVWVETGVQSEWETVTLDLPQLDDQAQVRIRWRLTSDTSVQRDGWYVDDVVLTAVPDAALQGLFADGFEGGNTDEWSRTAQP